MKCTKIKHLLTVYEQASGQAVNCQNSDILYNSNAADNNRVALSSTSSVHQFLQYGQYLDLPSITV